MKQVFLSYSRRDEATMLRIKEELEAEGLGVWIDQTSIEMDEESWKIAIEQAIETTQCLVALLSPAAKRSKWVRRELAYARGQGKKRFLILLEGNERNAIPLDLTEHQRLDVSGISLDSLEFSERLQPLVQYICDYVGIIPISQRRERVEQILHQIQDQLVTEPWKSIATQFDELADSVQDTPTIADYLHEKRDEFIALRYQQIQDLLAQADQLSGEDEPDEEQIQLRLQQAEALSMGGTEVQERRAAIFERIGEKRSHQIRQKAVDEHLAQADAALEDEPWQTVEMHLQKAADAADEDEELLQKINRKRGSYRRKRRRQVVQLITKAREAVSGTRQEVEAGIAAIERAEKLARQPKEEIPELQQALAARLQQIEKEAEFEASLTTIEQAIADDSPWADVEASFANAREAAAEEAYQAILQSRLDTLGKERKSRAEELIAAAQQDIEALALDDATAKLEQAQEIAPPSDDLTGSLGAAKEELEAKRYSYEYREQEMKRLILDANRISQHKRPNKKKIATLLEDARVFAGDDDELTSYHSNYESFIQRRLANPEKTASSSKSSKEPKKEENPQPKKSEQTSTSDKEQSWLPIKGAFVFAPFIMPLVAQVFNEFPSQPSTIGNVTIVGALIAGSLLTLFFAFFGNDILSLDDDTMTGIIAIVISAVTVFIILNSMHWSEVKINSWVYPVIGLTFLGSLWLGMAIFGDSPNSVYGYASVMIGLVFGAGVTFGIAAGLYVSTLLFGDTQTWWETAIVLVGSVVIGPIVIGVLTLGGVLLVEISRDLGSRYLLGIVLLIATVWLYFYDGWEVLQTIPFR